ncbi:hypothetical protein ACQP0C_41695 (plasmid) [Nocardia sp. CA-129566]|uniref:hypothetical protein n=1 Tax=Nocardia sp. CA-129566 TaxID=3239976 RepID=UPI003D992855
MTTAYTCADRATLADAAATDLGTWANHLTEVLAQVGSTPATANLVCSSDTGDRLYSSLTELADLGGSIDLNRLHAALPVLLRPLLGAPDAGFPRLTDLIAAAVELIARAEASHAITVTIAGAEHDPTARAVDSHLQFAGSVLRQALTMLDPTITTSGGIR